MKEITEDWFDWIVCSEAKAGNPDPVLTAAKAEAHIKEITGKWPVLNVYMIINRKISE